MQSKRQDFDHVFVASLLRCLPTSLHIPTPGEQENSDIVYTAKLPGRDLNLNFFTSRNSDCVLLANVIAQKETVHESKSRGNPRPNRKAGLQVAYIDTTPNILCISASSSKTGLGSKLPVHIRTRSRW
jgi:hypothetical protein